MGPLLYFKRTDLIARSFIFSTSIQLAITFPLIYFLGFNGIIIAYIINKPFQVLFVYLESKRMVYLPINPLKQITLPCVLFGVALFFQLLVKDNQAFYYNPMIGMIILAITAFFYRREIKPFFFSLIKAKS